jgi:two-component system, LytTR family, sensor kinase
MPSTRRRLPLLGIFVVWTLFGLWTAQQNLLLTIASGRPVTSYTAPFEVALLSMWVWALMTPALMQLTRWLHDHVASRSLRIAAHVGTFVVVHMLDSAVWFALNTIAHQPVRPFVQLLFALGTLNLLAYATVVAFTTALDYQDGFRERGLRAAQLEAQLALSQLQALRAQLHPHFLFNSLNAISALMHKDVGRADRMLARLSELLRSAIDGPTTPEIALIDEVAFVQRYLEIEQMRFGERLDVRLDVPVETYDALVPNMLLQPLVENAVRHGVAPHAGAGRVEICATRTGSQLGIVVRDTGKGLDLTLTNGAREGVGLRTTRARLSKLYGAAQELALVNVPGGGFETRVLLPFRRRQESPDEDSLSRR